MDGKPIENLSNQEIHDYLVNTYGSADEKFEQMTTAQIAAEEQPSTLSEDELRAYAKSYVDNWNGYDNTIKEESWKEIDGVEVKYYIFQDGPTQHIVGVYVNSYTGAVTGDYGGIQY